MLGYPGGPHHGVLRQGRPRELTQKRRGHMTTEAETARSGSLQPPGSQRWEGGPWSPRREQDPVDTLTLGFQTPEP